MSHIIADGVFFDDDGSRASYRVEYDEEKGLTSIIIMDTETHVLVVSGKMELDDEIDEDVFSIDLCSDHGFAVVDVQGLVLIDEDEIEVGMLCKDDTYYDFEFGDETLVNVCIYLDREDDEDDGAGEEEATEE